MQVKKQELEPDMKQQIDSKLGMEYVKAVYCHPAYLTYIQNTLCKMPGWIKQKLESRLLREISIPQIWRWHHPYSKKWRGTTRPLKYDLIQLPYYYTVEVTNKFKGIYLIDKVQHYTGGSDQNHPPEKEMQKAHTKKFVSRGLANNWEKKSERQREKERYIHLNAEFERIARLAKKAFLSDQCKEIEESNRKGNTRNPFKKIKATKGIFHSKMGTIKDRNNRPKRSRRQ